MRMLQLGSRRVSTSNIFVTDQLTSMVTKLKPLMRPARGRYLPIIWHQHLLPTTYPLIVAADEMRQESLRTKNFITGKIYSTNQDTLGLIKQSENHEVDLAGKAAVLPPDYLEYVKKTVEKQVTRFDHDLNKLPTDKIASIAVVDDGGHLCEQVKNLVARSYPNTPVFYVEQTRSGINGHQDEVINVAQCAVKQVIESKIIANNLLKLMKELLGQSPNKHVGIIGAAGAMGSSMVDSISAYLKKTSPGKKVIAFNLKPRVCNNIVWVNNIHDLIAQSDVIISASGRDAMKRIQSSVLKLIESGGKSFINMGSANELLTLVSLVQRECCTVIDKPLGDIVYGNSVIKCSGYPYNLVEAMDDVDYDHPIDFAPTRGLLFAGLIQGWLLSINDYPVQHYCLSPTLQQYVLNYCMPMLQNRHGDDLDFERVDSVEKISALSVGEPLPSVLEDQLASIFEESSNPEHNSIKFT